MEYLNLRSAWADLVHTYNPHQIEFWGIIIVQILMYWIPSTCFLLLDTVFPNFSHRHKLQPAPKQATRAEIVHCTLLVLRNQLISLSIQLATSYFAHKSGKPSTFRVAATPPALTEFLRDLVICVIVREFMFYYTHRLFHTPRLYKIIHKTHHKFTAPMSLSSQYAHPVEHLLANTLPVVLPAMLLNSHIWTFWAWLTIVLLDTSTVHSGYDFFLGAAKAHDAHHEKFNVNYGVIGFLDCLHGTDGSKSKKKGE